MNQDNAKQITRTIEAFLKKSNARAALPITCSVKG
jgi:hypothetical protein